MQCQVPIIPASVCGVYVHVWDVYVCGVYIYDVYKCGVYMYDVYVGCGVYMYGVYMECACVVCVECEV